MINLKKYDILQRINIDALYNKFLGLPPQQQTIAIVVAAVVSIFIVLLPISLISGKIGGMQKSLNKSQSEMGNIVYEIDEYNKMKSKLNSLEKQLKSGFDSQILTTLDNIASKEGISENVESIKQRDLASKELYDEQIAEVRLSKIPLQQLTNFLYAIEHDRNRLLRVKNMRMRTRFDDKHLFDVSFQVSTYKLQQEG